MGFGIKRNTTDALFSDLVREKADWICERCSRDFSDSPEIFDTSHFHSRRNRSVRFDFDNVAALCRGCHIYFGEHPNDHADFFLAKLGPVKYQVLNVRVHTPMKIDDKALRIGFKMELERIRVEKKAKIIGAR